MKAAWNSAEKLKVLVNRQNGKKKKKKKAFPDIMALTQDLRLKNTQKASRKGNTR